MDDSHSLFESEGYLLEELLHADEWGELYRARYAPHRRNVLFRRLPGGIAGNEAAWDLMRAEVQAWARLDHPGILQVLDWGATRVAGVASAKDEAFIATEMPSGTRLDLLLPDPIAGGAENAELERAPGGLEVDEIFLSLLEAVEAACRWGVLHLGLRPACIWVGPGERVQVSDFGLWYVSRDFPEFGRREDPFLSPEQLAGDRVCAATDVYALAMLFLELHCGPGTALEVFRGAGLPREIAELSPVLECCLDPRPIARYRSGGELAVALGLDAGAAGQDACTVEYRDCPLCRLKSEIHRDVLHGEGRSGRPVDSEGVVQYVWLIAIALAVACVVVWWMALR